MSLHSSWAFADPFRRGEELQLCPHQHKTPISLGPSISLSWPFAKKNCQSPYAPCYIGGNLPVRIESRNKQYLLPTNRRDFVTVAYPLLVQTKNHPVGPKGVARSSQVSTTISCHLFVTFSLLKEIIHWRSLSLETFWSWAGLLPQIGLLLCGPKFGREAASHPRRCGQQEQCSELICCPGKLLKRQSLSLTPFPATTHPILSLPAPLRRLTKARVDGQQSSSRLF